MSDRDMQFVRLASYLYGSVGVIGDGVLSTGIRAAIEARARAWVPKAPAAEVERVVAAALTDVESAVTRAGDLLYGTPALADACVGLSKLTGTDGREALLRDLYFLAGMKGKMSLAESSFIGAIERAWKIWVPRSLDGQVEPQSEDEAASARRLEEGVTVGPEAFGAPQGALPLPQAWWWEHLGALSDATVEKGPNRTPTSRTGRHERLWVEAGAWVDGLLSAMFGAGTETWVNRPNQFQIGKLSYTYWARIAPLDEGGLGDAFHVGLQISKRLKWVDEAEPELADLMDQPVLGLWASTDDRLIERLGHPDLPQLYGQVQHDLLRTRPELWARGGALVRIAGERKSRLLRARTYIEELDAGQLTPEVRFGPPRTFALFSPLVTLDQVRADPAGVSRMVATYLKILAEAVRAGREAAEGTEAHPASNAATSRRSSPGVRAEDAVVSSAEGVEKTLEGEGAPLTIDLDKSEGSFGRAAAPVAQRKERQETGKVWPATGDMLLDFLMLAGVWPDDLDPFDCPNLDEMPAEVVNACKRLFRALEDDPDLWLEVPPDLGRWCRIVDLDDRAGVVPVDRLNTLPGLENYPWHKRGPLWYSSGLLINNQYRGPVLLLRDGWVGCHPADDTQFMVTDYQQYPNLPPKPAISEKYRGQLVMAGNNGIVSCSHDLLDNPPWAALSMHLGDIILRRLVKAAVASEGSGSFVPTVSHPPIGVWTEERIRSILRGDQGSEGDGEGLRRKPGGPRHGIQAGAQTAVWDPQVNYQALRSDDSQGRPSGETLSNHNPSEPGLPDDIPTVGRGTITLLKQHGITSALDIVRKGFAGHKSLSGVGPAKWALLTDWARRSLTLDDCLKIIRNASEYRDTIEWANAYELYDGRKTSLEHRHEYVIDQDWFRSGNWLDESDRAVLMDTLRHWDEARQRVREKLEEDKAQVAKDKAQVASAQQDIQFRWRIEIFILWGSLAVVVFMVLSGIWMFVGYIAYFLAFHIRRTGVRRQLDALGKEHHQHLTSGRA